MKILITCGRHPGEYTAPVAKRVGELLEQRGYNVDVKRFPFEQTGWGRAFNGESAEEVDNATNRIGYTLDFFEKTTGYDMILDFHTSPDYVADPFDMKLENFSISSNDGALARGTGLGCVHVSRFSEYTDNIPEAIKMLYVVEIPHVERRTSERFMNTVTSRIDGDILNTSYDYFRLVGDKKATLAKYPIEELSAKLADELDNKILRTSV
ncbi:MAG: hypothetical protein ABIJ92_00280 [Candidatus Aenigmatarchaeota archaeon]